jgi:hypothetical protein
VWLGNPSADRGAVTLAFRHTHACNSFRKHTLKLTRIAPESLADHILPTNDSQATPFSRKLFLGRFGLHRSEMGLTYALIHSNYAISEDGETLYGASAALT